MARRSEAPDPDHSPNRFIVTRLPTAGVRVDQHNVLCIAAVWECVRIISETLAMLPWRVFQMQADGGRSRRSIEDGEALDFLLHKRPNPETPALYFKEAIQAHALLWGNGYAEIERARGRLDGDPVALHLMLPDQVEAKRASNGTLFYEYTGATGRPIPLRAEQVFHVRGLSWDGHNGYELVRLARETLSTALATEQFTASFFGNGANLGGVIEAGEGKSLGEEGVKNLLKSFNRRNRGPRNAHRTEYLDKGMKYTEIGHSPRDSQLIEAKRFNVLDVARWFRMPPHKLAHLDDSIKANIEAQGIEFVTDTMLPWVLRWEQEADFKFFDAGERGRRFTKMDVNFLMRGDSSARGSYYKTMTGIGAFSINDVLDLEDRDSIGPDGDLRLVPMNMVSLSEANRTGNTGLTRSRSTDAHFSMFEEQVRRMTRRECVGLMRNKNATEAGFLSFAGPFYVEHEKRMTQDLLRPALALAEFFSELPNPEAAGEAVESFVAAHCRAAKEQAIEAHRNGRIEQYTAAISARVHTIALDVTSTIAEAINREEVVNE